MTHTKLNRIIVSWHRHGLNRRVQADGAAIPATIQTAGPKEGAAPAGLLVCGRRRSGKLPGLRWLGALFISLVLMHLQVKAAGSVTLTWDASTDSTVAGYKIYCGSRSGVYTNVVDVGPAMQATIGGLTPGKTYYFAAKTYSASGVESPFSGEISYSVPWPPNQPPTLNALNNLTINENTGARTVSLSGISSGSTTENQTLTVKAFSSNIGLVPAPRIRYASPRATGSLIFAPKHNASGTAIITVVVNDGQAQNNLVARTFTVTVVAGRGHPTLISSLSNQVAVVGQAVMFGVTPAPGFHLTYQWKFNGSPLSTVTGPFLALNRITASQAGIYSVTASNGKETTSSTATLAVYPTATATLAPAIHAAGQYAMTVTGVPGGRYAVQASSDLVNWTSLQTNTAPFTFVDINAGRFSQRFYRTVYNP